MEQFSLELNVESLKAILNENGELFDENGPSDIFLPLNIDVVAIIYSLRESKGYHVSLNDRILIAAKKIIGMWEKTGIPIIQFKAVKSKMVKLVDLYKKTKQKIHKERIKCNSTELKFLNDIFNISSCKCLTFDEMVEINLYCKCALNNKISANGLAFLIDQKNERKFTLDNYPFTKNIDELKHVNVIVLSDSEDDGSHSLAKSLSSEKAEEPLSIPIASSALNLFDDEKKENDDPDYVPDKYCSFGVPHKVKLPGSLNEINFESVFAEAVRYDTGYGEVAAIMNRTLEVLGAITNQEKGLVITKSFAQRGIKRIGKKMTRKWHEDNAKNSLECFFFDGVKAKNLMLVERNGTLIQDSSILYENIVMVQQPFDRYLGFFATMECSADKNFFGMKNFFVKNNISLQNLIAIGSDGASTNTGADNGIIAKFEAFLNRPLHWIICLLHLLDLILRAVVTVYFGDTIGPGKYLGKINCDLNDCHTYRIVDFTEVCLNNMPTCVELFEISLLNSDQKYLYEMSKAVATGNVPDNLANRRPGDLSDPRWTCLASRLLRLYVSTETPSLKLIGLVHFIQNVYVPCIFWIKCFPDWTDGARHLYRILSFSLVLPKNIFKAIKDRVLYNSYFAHTENLLLSMITDADENIRRAGYTRILEARSSNLQRELVDDVRIFRKPRKLEVQHSDEVKHNNIDHYAKIIDWNETEVFEPPITNKLTVKQIKSYMENNDQIIVVPRIPSHSQATELCVQVVKNVVRKYPGTQAQEERTKTKIFARNLNPQFTSEARKKADYQCYEEN